MVHSTQRHSTKVSMHRMSHIDAESTSFFHCFKFFAFQNSSTAAASRGRFKALELSMKFEIEPCGSAVQQVVPLSQLQGSVALIIRYSTRIPLIDIADKRTPN